MNAQTNEDATTTGHEIWLLRLVPSGPWGRWVAALVLLAGTIALFQQVGAFGGFFAGGDAWAAALFFCVILAYITPVFHLVTERTEAAFDALVHRLGLNEAEVAHARRRIRYKSGSWALLVFAGAFCIWVLQSWLLAGSVAGMVDAFSSNPLQASMTIMPFFVWWFMITSMVALSDNADLFGELAERIEVDLLDPHALTPFGHMAVSSMLVTIGAMASLAITWLSGTTSPWATLPGLMLLSGTLVYLLVRALWPVHVLLRDARRDELDRLQTRIDGLRVMGAAPDDETLIAIQGLLVYRREVLSVREWPLDFGVVARFGLYLFIVPMTWVGAALIEYVVGFVIGS